MGQPVMGREREQRHRRDSGSIKATERDFELLGFVGEQYAVTVVQLGRLIERRLDTARSLRDRWKRAGWIDSAMLTTTAPSFLWLTGRGARVRSSAFRVWQPNHGLAAHIQAVTDVRIHLERALRLGSGSASAQSPGGSLFPVEASEGISPTVFCTQGVAGSPLRSSSR